MPRKLIPTNVHKLDKGKLYGNLAARAAAEPKPIEKLEPKCPRRLTKEERRYWKFYADITRNYGTFIIANAPALERLAINTAMLVTCREKIRKEGMYIVNEKGQQRRTRCLAEFYKLQDEIRKDEDRIGAHTQGLAKIGVNLAKAKEVEGIRGLLD